MRRRLKNALKTLNLFLLLAFFGYIFIQAAQHRSPRTPAATYLMAQEDFDHATLAVSANEFQNSKPQMGRSYFDLVFSEQKSNVAEYSIPYPFNRLIERLEDYSGKKMNAADSSGPKVVIFPMGRSLQRNAAIQGLTQAFSFDPFFRYPRVVIGMDEEPTRENSLMLNLKNKLYIGFNERAEILEAISYNDEEGRYEYQVVHDYASGKKPKVVYANRSLCLSCHQNQTPIFSEGPWSESNGNPQISDELKKKLDAALGTETCVPGKYQTYCYKGANDPYYFGAPIRIDINEPSRFDLSTDFGNLSHAYQKMWKELCVTPECRLTMIKNIILFRLTGQIGLVQNDELTRAISTMESNWQKIFLGGLAIPSPNIPNRDPLKDLVASGTSSSFTTVAPQDKKTVQDLLAQSKIPTEFEPLQPRAPIKLWKDSGVEVTNTNRMLRGFADEFTVTDLRMIDGWLKKNKSSGPIVTELSSNCDIDADGANLVIACHAAGAESFSLNTYLNINDRAGQGEVNDFLIQSDTLKCDSRAAQTENNIFQGKSCFAASHLKGGYFKSDDQTAVLFLQQKGDLSLRTLQGFYIAEIFINLTSKKETLKVYNQDDLLRKTIQANQTELLKMKSFSRFQIMKTLMTAAQVKMDLVQNTNLTGLDLIVDGSTNLDSVLAQSTGPLLLKNVCAQCHRNNEGVPPNFMGDFIGELSDFDQCRRLEQCAPRMLYRLKMRNCEASALQKKKNPMPPESFLRNNSIAATDWMKNHNPKVLQYIKTFISPNDLTKSLTDNGMTPADAKVATDDIINADCPTSRSVIYDQLPVCEFTNLKSTTKCK